MNKLITTLIAALVVPAVALAAKPTTTTTTTTTPKVPQVMYILKGKLTAYSAANGSTKGSVSILVKSANYNGASLKTQTLTFATSSSTKVVAPHGVVKPNDTGLVKVRGPKKAAANTTLAAVLQAATAFEILDQRASG
jgi:hypothetical protein